MLHVIRLLGLAAAFFTFSLNTNAADTVDETKFKSAIDSLVAAPMTDGLKNRLETIQREINSGAYASRNAAFKEKLGAADPVEQKPDSADEKVVLDRAMLFISASMPRHVLRRYVQQLDSLGGGTMVMRGFIGGAKKMLPTLKFISSITNIDESCQGGTCKKYRVDVIIDPILFKRHGVLKVPAFTVYEKKTYVARCDAGDSVEQALIVYGDASVKALATELQRIDKRPTVARLIKKVGY